MTMNKLNDDKTSKIKENISTQNLILIPVCKDSHWIIHLLIRSSVNSFMLVTLDSMSKPNRQEETNIIKEWFESSLDVINNNITLTIESIELSNSLRQKDNYSCGYYVCLYSYVASILSMQYHSTKNIWLSYFTVKMKELVNDTRLISISKKELQSFCLLIRKEDVEEVKIPDEMFLDNFISISALNYSLDSEIINNNFMDLEEHENNLNKTKTLFKSMSNHFGKIDCNCSMDEWFLKNIVSKLTIKLLIDYDEDEKYQFPNMDCWYMFLHITLFRKTFVTCFTFECLISFMN